MRKFCLIIITGFLFLCFFLKKELSAKEIYVTLRDNSLFITDYPLGNDSKLVIKEKNKNLPKDIPYQEEIIQLAQKEGIDPNFVTAVIKTESNFNQNAISQKGALGLMQIMPKTAQKYRVQNPFNIKENLTAGIKHLKNLLILYKGNKNLALAAYNAGKSAVKKYGGVPPYPETQKYIKNVNNYYQKISQNQNGITDSKNSKVAKKTKIYRLVNKNGSVVYTNLPSSS